MASIRVGDSHSFSAPCSRLHTGSAVKSANCDGEMSERARVSFTKTTTKPMKRPTAVVTRRVRAAEGDVVSSDCPAAVSTRPAVTW